MDVTVETSVSVVVFWPLYPKLNYLFVPITSV